MSTSPANALSPRAMLAAAIHAQPGSYALLLGSGVSRSAGIPTGWGVVQDLVRRAAIAEAPQDTESHQLAAANPEAWWQQRGQGELGYSSVLAALASSSAARQGLLERYFVPSGDEDGDAGTKEPAAAHKAVAALVKSGWIKIVITTNFDRLIEEALTAAGVRHQVIDRPEQVGASRSVAHGPATVIKLHGDWTDLESRNTIDELDEYPDPWVELLTRIFNEYGLLISGWSAEWDKALVRVLESTPRRYPLYWDSRSSKSQEAQRILNRLGGHVVPSENADELFTSLASSVDALDRLTEPPLETAMTVARLKRALPDPMRRIELQDLIEGKTADVITSLRGVFAGAQRQVDLDPLLNNMLEATRPLLPLLVNGVRYDDGTHTRLWTDALQRLLDARRTTTQLAILDDLQHYPALLALRAMSIEAIRRGRDDLMIELLTGPRWRHPFHGRRPISAAEVLHLNLVLDGNMVDRLPRWDGEHWSYPASHLLKVVLEDFFADQGMEASDYDTACDDVEYRTGLVQYLASPADSAFGGPNMGEFNHTRRWEHAQPPKADQWAEVPAAENRFRDDFNRGIATAWTDLFGERTFDEVVDNYRTDLNRYRRF